MIEITLSPEQIDIADEIAVRRRRAAISKSRVSKNGASYAPGLALQRDILGARCECAAYLYLRPKLWHYLANEVAALPDFDDWIDAKGRAQNWHEMMVQRDDPPYWAYLLVRAGMHPTYQIVGWCYGREAQQAQFWKDPAKGRPAFFVPANAAVMKPPETLALRMTEKYRAEEALRAADVNHTDM